MSRQAFAAGRSGTRPASVPMTTAENDRRPVKYSRDRRRVDFLKVENHILTRAPLFRGSFPSYGGAEAAHGPLIVPGRRVDRVIEVAVMCADAAAKEIDPSFAIEVDRDLDGNLTGIMFLRADAGSRLDVELSGRFLTTNDRPIGLSWTDAGARVFALLAREAAAVMGAPVRTLH